MEDKLFKFEGCDGDATLMVYHRVTLNVDIGEFKAGHQFDSATINFEKSQLSFYDKSNTVLVLKGRYELGFQVGTDLLND